MFQKAKAIMEDHLKAFGAEPVIPIREVTGKGVFFQAAAQGPEIAIGADTVIEEVPLAEWLIATGNVLLLQSGSSIAPLYLGPDSESNDTTTRITDDLFYVIDLTAIYQCYLQNPVEVYCIYDDAVELGDEESLHPLAVSLGLSHPRGIEAMGFDKRIHSDVFEEAEFFKPVITQKRPDLSLLVALENAWLKQKGTAIRLSVVAGILRFSATV